MPSVTPDPTDKDAEPFVEIDPTGRYGRYDDLLGGGAVNNLYTGFDQGKGIEVAWNQIYLRCFCHDEAMMEGIYSELRLLQAWSRNDNVISLLDVWEDDEKGTLNIIVEVSTSGNLRDYRKKHRRVSMKAIKKWSNQILKGLEHLHLHQPCIILRNLNCANIFINGNIGQVKIGEVGLAAILGRRHADAHWTSEFMAPELFQENYNYTEKVDIYSFGLCVLEMVTLELPYGECDSSATISNKVTSGVLPTSINKVKDLEVRAFILKCLAHRPNARPSASRLLQDSFFDGIDDDDNNFPFLSWCINLTEK